MWALLTGCAPGAFTADEARVVYEAVSSVNADTYAALYVVASASVGAPEDAPEDAPGTTDSGVTWHTEADGGRFEGVYEGPGSWTGLVEIDGAYTVSVTDAGAARLDWAVDTTFVDVAYGPLRLDGDMAWTIRDDSDGRGSSHQSTVVGDIVARGEVRGAGALDYATIVTFTGGRYQVDIRGTVGGQDISGSYDATAFAL